VIAPKPVGGRRRAASRPRLGRTPRALLLLLLLAVPGRAGAHGTPIDIRSWGDFPLPIARCQRVLGRAAAACGLRVWRARRDCALAPLRGASCDAAATAAIMEAARIAALDDVSGACTPLQLSNLQFLDVREAQADVIRFCRELDDAATSLILDPLAGASTDDTVACGVPAAEAATRLFAMAFRSRQHVLDRIAASAIPARRKLAMIATSTAAIDDVAARLVPAITATCPAEQFAALYGRSAAELLALAAARADCLAGTAYAQSTVLCPPAVCGNRVREGDEECDDGNTADGDGCGTGCLRESALSRLLAVSQGILGP
jgi:cysteine-rich repeat protein